MEGGSSPDGGATPCPSVLQTRECQPKHVKLRRAPGTLGSELNLESRRIPVCDGPATSPRSPLPQPCGGLALFVPCRRARTAHDAALDVSAQ
jgi:hypothetical protein